MRIAVLILAWITPALIAGALGWSGIWGTGSALVEYLIPIPVAGGALHVPSFAILAAIVASSRRWSGSSRSFLPLIAFGVAGGAMTGMVDFDRLNGWLFTDYEPYGSPVRFDGNPLFLFVMTDAIWAGVFTLAIGQRPPARSWAALPAVPLAVIAIVGWNYKVGGPVFEIGPGLPGSARGDQLKLIYTSVTYDEPVLLEWLEASALAPPWTNPNVEHEAIVFTSSLQLLKWAWRDPEEIRGDTAVATICRFEEDQSVVVHPGYYDCFADRETVEEALAGLAAREPTGLGRDIDSWFALVRFCDGVEIADQDAHDIKSVGMCIGMRRVYPERLSRIAANYGEDSPQFRFVRDEGAARDLAQP
jgi:hypothetical protein